MGSTIIITLAVFLTVTLLLVGLLLFAKAKLSPSGLVKIQINGEKTLEVEAGSTLLTTLGEAKGFLPSACGGGGTCAMCKCQVIEGGGEILPTEAPYFSRKAIAENWRLGCQVKVKGDMVNQGARRGLRHQEVGMRSGLELQRGQLYQGIRGEVAGR